MQEITIAYQRLLEQHRYKYVALYHALREAILSGTLPARSRLPSTRRLAEMYGVSRGIVAEAYDLLLAEGYVEAAVGKGTYVSEQVDRMEPSVYEADPNRNSNGKIERQNEIRSTPTLSRWGQRIMQLDTTQPAELSNTEHDASLADMYNSEKRAANAGNDATLATSIAKSDVSDKTPPHAGHHSDKMPYAGHNQVRMTSAAALDAVMRSNASVPFDATAPTPTKLKPTTSSSYVHDEKRQLALSPISFCPQDLVLHGNSLTDWKAALSAASQDMQSAHFAEDMSTIGDMRLREAICADVGRTRGIRAHPAQVILYSGSQEALVLLCQLLINEQESVVVEDPCYTGIMRAVRAAGGELLGVPIDRQGIIPANWNSRLLFVTPARQFPTGAVLPLARRQQLLQWADRQGAWIVEDDYDSEFRWGGRPLEPLKALDHSEQVIYVGSFSKSMFTALRIGYAIVPPALIQPLVAAKSLYAPLPSSPLEQRALARFMQRGDYMRHLRRMTRLYRPRFHELHRLLTERLSELFDWMDTDSGLHIYGSWRLERSQYEQFRREALELGVIWKDASLYQLSAGAPAVCFSFAHTDEQQIRQGMERLEQAWQRTLG